MLHSTVQFFPTCPKLPSLSKSSSNLVKWSWNRFYRNRDGKTLLLYHVNKTMSLKKTTNCPFLGRLDLLLAHKPYINLRSLCPYELNIFAMDRWDHCIARLLVVHPKTLLYYQRGQFWSGCISQGGQCRTPVLSVVETWKSLETCF